MRVAQVVPLRRLPADRAWFDYALTDEIPAEVGHLVEIPFGNQSLPGVIWAITPHSQIKELRPIHRLLRPEPIISPWQHQALSQMATSYFVSLGHMVARAVPDFPKKLIAELGPLPPPLRFRPAPSSHERLWWYRDRQQVASDALQWLLKVDRP